MIPEETILVVDDEIANLQKLHRTFAHRYNILTANSGREALELLRENPETAVIIADQRMPDITGSCISIVRIKVPIKYYTHRLKQFI